MDTPPFKAKRITRTYRQTIDAAPEKVFPLLYPVREAEWLDGWRYRMIYTASGLVEDGAVVGTTTVGDGAFDVAFDGANVWVVNQLSNTVSKR